MTCDVIIPVYNNRAVLPATLTALFSQAVPTGHGARVIISDDGSTDDTLAWLRRQTAVPPWRLTILSGPHTGPGGARNRALKASRAEIAFFLGADILLRPNVLAAHLAFHARHPEPTAAALGAVRWDPTLCPSPLMEWMTHGGQQNAFDDLLGRLMADPADYFYGSHLSLKRAALTGTVFSASLSGGWEDLELGRRLADQSFTLHVLHSAVGLHRHPYSLQATARRQSRAGAGLLQYQALHPASSLVPRRPLLSHVCRWLFCALGGQLLLYLFLRSMKNNYSLPRSFAVFTSNELWKGLWVSSGGFMAFLKQFRAFSSNNS